MSDLPTVIGRYEVLRQLGEGGMGVLYLAADPVLDRHVALKLLRVESTDLRRRFVREAQSAARIQHPNIVTIYDVGDHEGQLYIAMEYIDGDTLAALIREDVPFSTIRKLDIIDEIADGLGFAHQRGIIHRDIKPANLMMTRSGLVKVLDFGIARVAHAVTGDSDNPTIVGTPAYMAPEQLEGQEADARSDIYAVGLVMYELLSGRRAFAAASTALVLEMVLAARPTPLEQLVPDIDPALARVVARAMSRHPADRHQDLQALRQDLARVRRHAMQASADEATIVVPPSAPIRGAAAATGPPATSPSAGSGSTGTRSAGTKSKEDAVLERLAADRKRTARSTRTDPNETVFAPLSSVTSPGPVTPAPSTGFTGASPTAGPVTPGAPLVASPPPLPQPAVTSIPADTGSVAAAAGGSSVARIADEGPMPVPLPAVPGSATRSQSTVSQRPLDTPHVAVTVGGAVSPVRASSPPRVTSPPRVPGAVAPAPLGPAAVDLGGADGPVTPPAPVPFVGVASRTTTSLPNARKGLSAAVIVGALIGLLGMFFLAAFLVVRGLGLFAGPSLLSRVLGTPSGERRQADATPQPPADRPAESPSQATPAPDAVPSDVPAAQRPEAETPVNPPPAVAVPQPPVTTTVPPAAPVASPSDPATTRPSVAERPKATPVAPQTRRVPPPARPTQSQATESRAQARTTEPATGDPEAPASVPTGASAAAANPEPVAETPRPVREPASVAPEPPPVLVPREEALALVRGYVAARNTSHASGIRRVWPTVDDVHLRRITSAFSAPLTLSTCDVEVRDATHAVATCSLTQPGTTGPYASGQAITIRRSFVFDLERQGRSWVIVALRE